jgi:hypothetical protein
MNNLINFKLSKSWITGLVLTLVLINLIYAGYFVGDAYPGHNMISNLAMAAAPLHHIGLPYKDYWDIYPPGIYLVLSPFEYFFHGQTIVFKIGHILFAIVIGLIVLKFLVRIFHKHSYQAMAVTVFFTLYLLLSNYYYSILFHNAFLALVFSVLGLYFLAFSNKTFFKYFLSSMLFAFSASIKETYLFTVILPLLYLCSRYLMQEQKSCRLFGRNTTLVIAGALLVFLSNYLYLNVLGVNESYREVSAYKSSAISNNSFETLFNKLNPFNVYDFGLQFRELSGAFFIHPSAILYSVFLLLWFSLFIPFKPAMQNGKWKLTRVAWSRERGIGLVISAFLLLHFVGFKLLEKYQPNYTLQMVPALVLAFAFSFHKAGGWLRGVFTKKYPDKSNAFRQAVNIVMLCCFAWFLVPKLGNFKFFKFMPPHEYIRGLGLKKPEVVFPDKVKQAMGNDKRVLYIYGWGTPYFYYFSNTRPFSRFFILHPSILGEIQIREFVEQFKRELPKVVMYTEDGSDMDTFEFENNTIHFKTLLQECYEFYPADIYPGFHCRGYYLLKSDAAFKANPNQFIAEKYLF